MEFDKNGIYSNGISIHITIGSKADGTQLFKAKVDNSALFWPTKANAFLKK